MPLIVAEDYALSDRNDVCISSSLTGDGADVGTAHYPPCLSQGVGQDYSYLRVAPACGQGMYVGCLIQLNLARN